MSNRLLFIGTGSSLGIPVIGCNCEVCQSPILENKRFRSSALLTYEGKKILIDASPDLRDQALRFHINHLDGVLFTHAHYDHTAGIDELRIFSFLNHAPLLCLASKETADDLNLRFSYLFCSQKKDPQKDPRLKMQCLDGKSGTTTFLDIPIKYLSYIQLGMLVTGFVVGSFAYITDIKEYDESIFTHLKGVETLVLSALRFTPSHMHFTVDDAVEFAEKTGAKKTWLTHIAHELDHEKTNHYLPSHIQLAYDGLEISLT